MLGAAVSLLVGMLVLVIAEVLVPSGTLPGPLYLIRAVRKRTRRVRRYTQITGILVRRGMLPYLRGSRRAELTTRDGRLQLARSLRPALEDGVTFIKLGQILATRRDLLPAEFIEELNGLQDDAPQVNWPKVEEVLRLELGAEVDDVFASFDRTPLAAASIAQVHAATLALGERVVVKVRRPGDRDCGRLGSGHRRSTRGAAAAQHTLGAGSGSDRPVKWVRTGPQGGARPQNRGAEYDCRGSRRDCTRRSPLGPDPGNASVPMRGERARDGAPRRPGARRDQTHGADRRPPATQSRTDSPRSRVLPTR
jgi:hypothetical protein